MNNIKTTFFFLIFIISGITTFSFANVLETENSNPTSEVIAGAVILIDSIADAGEYTGGPLSSQCPFENLTIQTSNYQEVDGFFTNEVVEETVPIADGTGEVYSSSILVNDFATGATINNPSTIQQICVVIEHSWLRDLNISLSCPNGNEIMLHEFSGTNTGGQVFLGVPYEPDEGIDPVPGEGWEYCWTMDAANGTWLEYADQNNPFSLPAGDYQPDDDFSNLLGCPINGAWTINIEDLWAIDNGFIFSWEITLHEGNEYQQTYIISNEGQEIVAQTDAAGFFDFSNNNITPGNYEVYAFNYKLNGSPQQFSSLSELSCDQNVDCCDLLLLSPITINACDFCEDLMLAVNVPDTLSICNDSIQIIPEILMDPAANMGEIFCWEGAETIDNNQPTIVELQVNGMPDQLTAESFDKICIDSLQHFWDADLQLYLITPNNDTLELSTNNGQNGDNYFNTCFSPTASTNITLGAPPFSGTFLPEGDFNTIFGNNKSANGIWKLLLIDNTSGLNGNLYKWSIHFNEIPIELTYQWTPDTGLSCSDCPNPIASPNNSTTYTLTTTAIASDTCITTNSLTILIPDESTCIDDGDCNNGIEIWDTTSCQCNVVSAQFGCTDLTASNYDPLANCDDGSCQFPSPCQNADSLQLVLLFNATGGNNWTDKTNWLQSGQPISTWYGVTTNADGCVNCIDLDGNANCLLDNSSAGNNLIGTLPSLDLPSLETLYLDDNLLTGCYPEFLCTVNNASLAGNVTMPWYGDITNFCEGFVQFDAPCDDGIGSADNDIINMNCECESVVGTNSISTLVFDIFPNPTNDLLLISTASTVTYEVILYNLLGQPVFIGNNTTVIDVKSFPKGTYFLLLRIESARIVEKVVVD